MPLFDRYIAVDWSAANAKRQGKDSIWIADWHDGQELTTNPATRSEAMSELRARLLAARRTGQRVLAGFDFPFGYPAGGALAVSGGADWAALWRWLADGIVDSETNESNRFALAARCNAGGAAGGPRYWGHHHRHSFDGLVRTRPAESYALVAEKRIAEARARTAQPVWKLYGNGSVGSQAMLGIARLEALRRDAELAADIAVWPFETDFDADLTRPIVIAEIYPSIVKVTPNDGRPKDAHQVEAMVKLFSGADSRGELDTLLAAPADLSPAQRRQVLNEEGWIVGVGA